MSNEKFPLVCVVGPTASGKTGLAAALSQRLDGEVVSADSMLDLPGLSIGTAKAHKRRDGGHPHHMIDFLSPEERFSVADYAAMARRGDFDIHERESSRYWREAPGCMSGGDRGFFSRKSRKTRKSGVNWNSGQRKTG